MNATAILQVRAALDALKAMESNVDTFHRSIGAAQDVLAAPGSVSAFTEAGMLGVVDRELRDAIATADVILTAALKAWGETP